MDKLIFSKRKNKQVGITTNNKDFQNVYTCCVTLVLLKSKKIYFILTIKVKNNNAYTNLITNYEDKGKTCN